MAKRKTSPYAQQAADLTLTRYGPEISALTALLRQAQTDRDTRISAAKSGAQLIQSSIDQARPGINSIYDTAGSQASAAQAVAAPQLAALPAGSPFAAAAALEQSGLTSRLAGARANALTDLSQQRIGAAQGAVGEQQAALRTFGQARGQIGQRAQDLAHEEGAFTASTIQQLLGADSAAAADAANQQANRDNTRGNALIGAGVDPNTGQPLPGHGPKPKTPSKPSATDRGAAADYGKAQAWIRSIDNAAYKKKIPDPNARRRGIAELLLKGEQASGIPAIPQAILTAALDMYFDKALSPKAVQNLHNQGYKVRALPNAITQRQAGPKLTPAQKARQRAASKGDWVQKIFAALNG